MQKDEYLIGYAERYIVLPKAYAVWDTQINAWVADTVNSDKSTVHETAHKFNEWNNNANKPNTL